MKILTWFEAGAGANHTGQQEVEFERIVVSDYGNICGCCGAYAVEEFSTRGGVVRSRHNQGVVICLDAKDLPQDRKSRYTSIVLGEHTLHIRERTK